MTMRTHRRRIRKSKCYNQQLSSEAHTPEAHHATSVKGKKLNPFYAASPAASDALDPFHFDVKLDDEEEDSDKEKQESDGGEQDTE